MENLRMLDVFSTREIAIFIWLCVLFGLCITSKGFRSQIVILIKCALNIHIVLPFVILGMYSSLITIFISKFVFWKWLFVKDVIIWTIFVGIPICFSATNNAEKEKNFFRNIIVDNLKITAVVEFFTGAFTFNIFIELILQLVLVLLTVLEYFTGKNDSHKLIHKICHVLMSLIGLIVIVFSLKLAIESFSFENSFDLLVEFLIPLVFSVAFVPASFFLAIYAKYQTLFCRISFKEPKENKWKYRAKILVACNFRISRIKLFQRNYVCKIYRSISDVEYNRIIEDFTKEVKRK